MKKKIFYFAILFLFLAFPTSLFATVSIGDEEYATLFEAVADVPTDGTKTTIKVDSETTETTKVVIASGKDIILDLNNNVLTVNAGSSAMDVTDIENNGTLTVIDSSEAKGGILKGWRYPILNNGTLNVKSGALSSLTDYYTVVNAGTFNVDGGQIHNLYCPIINTTGTTNVIGGEVTGEELAGIVLRGQTGKVNIKGGTVYGGTYGVAIDSGSKGGAGNIYVSGGLISAGDGDAISVNATALGNPVIEISGGNVNAFKGVGVYMPHQNGILNIKNGSIIGKTGAVVTGGTLNVTNGLISGERNTDAYQGYEYIYTNYKETQNGTFSTGNGIIVVDRRGEGYKSVKAVNISGGTILADGTEAAFVYVDANNSSVTTKATLSISNGYFGNYGEHAIEVYDADGEGNLTKRAPFITGGSFDDDSKEYLVANTQIIKLDMDTKVVYVAGYDNVLPALAISKPGSTLIIEDGNTFTIPASKTFTIDTESALIVGEGGTLINNGTINNYGVFRKAGVFTNNGTINSDGLIILHTNNSISLDSVGMSGFITGIGEDSLFKPVPNKTYRTDENGYMIFQTGVVEVLGQYADVNIESEDLTEDEIEAMGDIYLHNTSASVAPTGLNEAIKGLIDIEEDKQYLATISVELVDLSIEENGEFILKFDATPYISINGGNFTPIDELLSSEGSTNTKPITFRLPLPSNTNHTHVTLKHGEVELGEFPIKVSADGSKYVDVTTKTFSEFTATLVTRNPQTLDPIMYVVIALLISGLAVCVVSYKLRKN